MRATPNYPCRCECGKRFRTEREYGRHVRNTCPLNPPVGRPNKVAS